MNKREAKKYFAKYIKVPCEECGAPAGKLCDTPAVWVHLPRLNIK